MDERLKDKWWRITHLYKIKNKEGRTVTFNPNDIQLRHLIERGGHRYNRILKARQFGITTEYAIDLLDEALWVPGMSCALIAHEAKKLIGYFAIFKFAYENLPEQLRPTTKTDTKYRYDFLHRFDGAPLNSSVYVDTDIRGGTVLNLHITEIAYNKDIDKLNSGSKQAVPKGGRISEETTANGYNHFRDSFMEAWKNTNPGEYDYKAYFYPWFLHDEYSLPGELAESEYTEYEQWLVNYAAQEWQTTVTPNMLLWRRWKMGQLKSESKVAGLSGEQLFKQEYPASISEAFQSGAGNVFDTEKVERTVSQTPLTLDEGIQKIDAFTLPDETKQTMIVAFKRLVDKEVKIWHIPQPGESYVCGVDPSDGTPTGDNGAIAIWRDELTTITDPIDKCAEYFGSLRPDELGDLAVLMCQFYNKAYIGVENNMLSTILHIVTNTGYDNYYYTQTIDEKTLKKTKKIGWRTDGKTRDPMIDKFIELFDEDNLNIRSDTTLDQMLTFVKKDNGKREHADGKSDDMLFADFIALQMRILRPKGARAFTGNPLG